MDALQAPSPVFPRDWPETDGGSLASTIPALLRLRAEQYPSRNALSAPSYRGYRIRESFSELLAQVEGIGKGLRSKVSAGDRIAVVLPAHAQREAVLWGFACLEIGAVWVPLDSWLAQEDLASALTKATPHAVVCLREDLDRIVSLANKAAVIVLDPRAGEVLRPSSNASESGSALEPDGIACINVSSGATGPANMVMHSHSGMLNAAMAIGKALRMSRDDVYQCTPVQAAGLNLVVACLIPWLSGASAVFEANGRKDREAIHLMKAEGTTVYQGAPSIVHRLADEYLNPKHVTPRLNRIVCAGALTSRELREKLHQQLALVEVIRLWGTTETGWAGTFVSSAVEAGPSSALGVPMPGCQVSVVDREGRQVAAAQVGEIAVRGPAIGLGYVSGPQMTGVPFSGGWVRSGDLGYLDSAGVLHFVDRMSDSVHVGAFVSSSRVEEVIRRCPGVADVAVVEVRHGTRDAINAIAACIVLDSGNRSNSYELSAFCATRLSPPERPRYWYFMDALPRGVAGKVLKRKLRESVAHLSPVSRTSRLSA